MISTRTFRHKKQLGSGNHAFHLINSVFWVIVMFLILYPLYLVIIASLSEPSAVLRGEVIWFPVNPSLEGYQAVLGNDHLFRAYMNSILYTVIGTSLSIMVTVTAAYALSQPRFPGKKFLGLFFVFTMFFSGGLIPTFLVMKSLGLYNNPLMLILNGLVTVWNLMVARTYIQTTIPGELFEAATIDGADHFQYFFRIALPLCGTIVAVLCVYYGVAKWNDYFTALVYIRDKVYLPLQTVMKEILATLQVDADMFVMDDAAQLADARRIAEIAKYCTIVISTGPVVLLYMSMQKYFAKGVMVGSLKG